MSKTTKKRKKRKHEKEKKKKKLKTASKSFGKKTNYKEGTKRTKWRYS